jgi:hypothetical protein
MGIVTENVGGGEFKLGGGLRALALLGLVELMQKSTA